MGHSKKIKVYDKMFPSIINMCEYYGLKYSYVVNRLRTGMSIEKIIENHNIVSSKQINNENNRKKFPCKLDEISYNSIFEAAQNLGLNLNTIYYLKNRYNLSADEALKQAWDKKKETQVTTISKLGKRKSCVVNGIEYTSQKEAMLAYNIPSITVYSRMQREGISFEEALVRGNKERKKLKIVQELFYRTKLRPISENLLEYINKNALKLLKGLEYYHYTCTTYKDLRNNTIVIKIQETFIADKQDVYLLLSENPMIIEMIIPQFTVCKKITESLLYILNDMNSSFLGAHFFYHQDSNAIVANLSQTLKETQDIKPILHSFFNFLGTAEHVKILLEN